MYHLQRDEVGSVCCVLRDIDGACIPRDPGNADWQRFLAWNAVQADPLDIDSIVPPDAVGETTQAQRLRYIQQAAMAYPGLTSTEKGHCSTYSNTLLNLNTETTPIPAPPASLQAAWVKMALPLCLLLACLPLSAKTALQFLQEATPPAFAKTHTLQPLTRWAWPLSVELQAELARRWGYTLDIPTDKGVLGADAEALIALAKAESLPVSTNAYRVMFEKAFQISCAEASFVHTATGTRFSPLTYSPLMPDVDVRRAAEAAAAGIRKLQARVPIAIVLNGGEYGFPVAGLAGGSYGNDPAILAAKGATDWDTFLSTRKQRQEVVVKSFCQAAAPGAAYIYYVTGDTRRGMAEGRWVWSFNYDQMKAASRYPSFQFYFGMDGDWTWGPQWANADVLTLATNAAGQSGVLPSYHWVCGGWVPGQVSDDARYAGFLSCLYLLGAVGNVAGYFAYPDGGFNGDVGATPPDWLRQLMILSRVHARFSHLDAEIRASSLVPGAVHRFLKSPSYELACVGARVIARKSSDGRTLLLGVWAADGVAKWVQVDLPEVGMVALRALPDCALYRVTIGRVTPIE